MSPLEKPLTELFHTGNRETTPKIVFFDNSTEPQNHVGVVTVLLDTATRF
jgi:hypothetical protein